MTGSGEDGSNFEKAMADARPLEDRDKVVRPRTIRRRRRTPADAPGEAVSFEVESLGDHVEGLGPGVDHGLLRKLRNGEFPPDARLDLHGFDEASARRRVHDTLLETRRQGGRCVLVIHGRGNRSPGGPVLKQALVGWLGEPAVGRSVLAFSSATNGDGGVGATYVLLKA
ncbi:MAG: Smr/MutS family protein [Myxococcota bacterium]|nr:Smr/MutS family protein [Myxococcota bacterium]